MRLTLPLDGSGYNKVGRSLQRTFSGEGGRTRAMQSPSIAAHDVAAEARAVASALIAVVRAQRRRPDRPDLGAQARAGRKELALDLNRAVRSLAGGLRGGGRTQRQRENGGEDEDTHRRTPRYLFPSATGQRCPSPLGFASAAALTLTRP